MELYSFSGRTLILYAEGIKRLSSNTIRLRTDKEILAEYLMDEDKKYVFRNIENEFIYIDIKYGDSFFYYSKEWVLPFNLTNSTVVNEKSTMQKNEKKTNDEIVEGIRDDMTNERKYDKQNALEIIKGTLKGKFEYVLK